MLLLTNAAVKEPILTVIVEGREVPFLVDSGATCSSIQSQLGFKTNGKTTNLSGFAGILQNYANTIPLVTTYGDVTVEHCFVVTTNLDVNILARDLLCDLGIMVHDALLWADTCNSGIQVKNTVSVEFWSPIPVVGILNKHASHTRSSPQGIDSRVWAVDKMQLGYTNVLPIKIPIKDGERLPSIRQYPLKREVEEGIKPLITSFLEQGVLVACSSPCNTPILRVLKKNEDYRLVQDLRAINKIVKEAYALVPNPATICSLIPAETEVFTLIDLQNAFFSIPLDKSSQYLFAFTFQGRQYTWTRLLQGFVNSPTIFSTTLQSQLRKIKLKEGSTVIQYIDDLLLASSSRDANEKGSVQLLNELKNLSKWIEAYPTTCNTAETVVNI
uniref:ribonuclease H n=1 Tax=Callorhinchus milii TaxID=7868 RepID=A0A4W3GRR4_CALMI